VSISELFGHRKGSFTGASTDHSGLFQAAHRGTLFLDEIGDAPPVMQGLILRGVGEGEILPLGESRHRVVDIRFVAASARDLKTLVEAGRFRDDLYYRLQLLRLNIPPLRHRRSDVALLASYYLRCLNHRSSAAKSLEHSAFSVLAAYDWPGNIRELLATLETAFYTAAATSISADDVLTGLATQRIMGAPAISKSPPWSEDTPARPLDSPTDEHDFWHSIYLPYMNRDLNRGQVREIVTRGLSSANGSYRRFLANLGVTKTEYLKAMDFLRHHRLKPTDRHKGPAGDG
jgi:transcriptional regulator with GAF, ATPase, and Fis domain